MGHNQEESKRKTTRSGKCVLGKSVGRGGWKAVVEESFLEEKRPREHSKAQASKNLPGFIHIHTHTYGKEI